MPRRLVNKMQCAQPGDRAGYNAPRGLHDEPLGGTKFALSEANLAQSNQRPG